MAAALVKFTAVLIAAFTGVNVLFAALGGAGAAHPALAGFVEDCAGQPQPCWYGIVPGLTVFQPAQMRLRAMGYRLIERFPQYSGNLLHRYFDSAGHDCEQVALYVQPNQVIEALVLICPRLRLGDLASQLGAPHRLAYLQSYTSGPRLYFGQTVQVRLFEREGWTSFYNAGVAVALANPDDQAADLDTLRWRGVARRWRYCQLEYVRADCLNYFR